MKIKNIILLFIFFTLTACYDSKELNNIAILTATEINKIDDNYIINAEVVNPQVPDKQVEKKSPFIIYTGTGKTIQQAYRQIKLSSSRYLYPEHLQVLIINERLAKEDVSEVLDFYLRDPSIRTEFYILISQDKNILSTTTPIEETSSSSIYETIKTNNHFQGVASLITLNELAIMSLNPNTEIIIPSIKLKNNNKETNTEKNNNNPKIDSMYELSGLAIFKENQLLGYLDNNQSISYNIIKNNIRSSILTYECEKDRYLSAEIIDSKSNIITNNNKINIKVTINTTINESNCNLKLNEDKNIKMLEKKLSLHLKNNLETDLNYIRDTYNSDVFGFRDEIYKHNYKEYLKIKDNWYNDIYKNYPINITVKANIISKGNVMEGYNEKN